MAKTTFNNWWVAIVALTFILITSDIVVNFRLTEHLVGSAFTWPLIFVLLNIVNRLYGPWEAVKVLACGLPILGILAFGDGEVSIRSTASCIAYLGAGVANIALFYHLYDKKKWWKAPLIAAISAVVIDIALYIGIPTLRHKRSLFLRGTQQHRCDERHHCCHADALQVDSEGLAPRAFVRWNTRESPGPACWRSHPSQRVFCRCAPAGAQAQRVFCRSPLAPPQK